MLNADVKVSGETTLRVAGMDCPDEVAAIERVLKPLSGVREVRVNLMGGKVTVAHDASIQPEKLITAIATAGLKAQLDKAGASDDFSASAQRARLISVAASGALTGLGLIMEWSSIGPAALSIGVFVCAIIAGGWFILPKTIGALQIGRAHV